MKKCDPPCHKTASLSGPGGPRIMVSQSGNKKFPAHTPHPQCPECSSAEYHQMLAEINRLEHPEEQKLFDKLEKLKGKG